MLRIMEVVAIVQAEGFSNGVRATSARVLKDSSGHFFLQVEDTARGVSEPLGRFEKEEDARDALEQYWRDCDYVMASTGATSWIAKIKL